MSRFTHVPTRTGYGAIRDGPGAFRAQPTEGNVLKTFILIAALTITLANTASAAVRPPWPADSYNATFSVQQDDERRLDHAKGSID